MSPILAPTGEPAVGTVLLTDEEAQLLRRYKRFLQARGLREALYCNACWSHDLADGTEAHVTPTDILIRCRCQRRVYLGASA